MKAMQVIRRLLEIVVPRPLWPLVRRLENSGLAWLRLLQAVGPLCRAQLTMSIHRPRRQGPLTVIIAEPCLHGVGGHEYQYASALSSSFVKRGIPAYVFAHRDLDGTVRSSLREQGTFCDGVFSQNSMLEFFRWPSVAGFLADAFTFSSELTQALRRNRITRIRLLFFPTSSLGQVLGCTLLRPDFWFSRGAESQVHLLHYNPRAYEWTPVPDLSVAHRTVFRLLRVFFRSRRIHIMSTSSAIASALQDLDAKGARVFPIPTTVGPRLSGTRSPKVIGYLGTARTEKGVQLLPDIVDQLLPRNAAIRFVFQVHLRHAFPEGTEALERLRVIASGSSQLLLIERGLATDEYHALLDEIDILLLPYAASNYTTRISSTCIEGMAAGKVIVGPDRGWMGEQGKAYGGYLGVDTGDVGQIIAATWQAVEDFHHLAEKAFADAGKFALHSVERTAGTLLELAGETGDGTRPHEWVSS